MVIRVVRLRRELTWIETIQKQLERRFQMRLPNSGSSSRPVLCDCPRVLHVFDGGPITIANEENADALFMQIEIVRFGVEQNILEETDEDSL
jgi:hypothetical protein